MQLSRLYNKRVQNEADRNPEFQLGRGIACGRGRSRPAGFNIVQMGSTNPAVRNQRENICPQIPPKDKLAPEVCDVARMSTAISGIFEVPAYRCAHPGM
jgi:hypothetical protein